MTRLPIHPGIDVHKVWYFASYAWTEVGIEGEECLAPARETGLTEETLSIADRILFFDVCGAFAIQTLFVIPFWMLMPDWGYDEDYLRRRAEHWYTRPRWQRYLNPLRLIGYPLAALVLLEYRAKLRKAVRAVAAGSASATPR